MNLWSPTRKEVYNNSYISIASMIFITLFIDIDEKVKKFRGIVIQTVYIYSSSVMILFCLHYIQMKLLEWRGSMVRDLAIQLSIYIYIIIIIIIIDELMATQVDKGIAIIVTSLKQLYNLSFFKLLYIEEEMRKIKGIVAII